MTYLAARRRKDHYGHAPHLVFNFKYDGGGVGKGGTGTLQADGIQIARRLDGRGRGRQYRGFPSEHPRVI